MSDVPPILEVVSARLRPDWSMRHRCTDLLCDDWAIGQVQYYDVLTNDVSYLKEGSAILVTSFRCAGHSYGWLQE